MARMSRQTLSFVSIVSVMVFIGLPLWWKTTTVYRSSLPYSDIGPQNQQIPSSISIRVEIASLLTNDDSYSHHHYHNKDFTRNVTLAESDISIQCSIQHKEIDSSQKLKIIEDITNNRDIATPIGHYTVYIVGEEDFPDWNDPSSLVLYSSQRYVVVKKSISSTDMSQLLTMLCGTDRMRDMLRETPSAFKEDGIRRMKVTFGYHITMTMIVPDPLSTEAEWNIQDATENYLIPFLEDKDVSLLGQYSINSQVLYYTNVHFKPTYSKKHGSFMVKPSNLPSAISNAEAKLGSHVSQWHAMNFVVYIPKRSEWPLYFSGPNGSVLDAFLVPQWGGVIIYNSRTPNQGMVEVSLDDVMATVVDQLKLLLSLNGVKDGLLNCPNCSHGYVKKWDVDHLLITRAIENAILAQSSLHSLTTLLDNVKNMVISDHIQKEVLMSLDMLHEFESFVDAGDWRSAYTTARSALNHSETAFFDPSILALLYFPDDQKYAVYIPLFLPICVPILLTMLKSFKSIKNCYKH